MVKEMPFKAALGDLEWQIFFVQPFLTIFVTTWQTVYIDT